MKEISRDELKKLIDKGEEYTLIDVRREEELKNGVIPTSKNIPLDLLSEALEMDEGDFEKKFKFKKPGLKDKLIFYCRSGGRAKVATEIAIKLGYKNSLNFAGSILSWSEIDKNVRKY